MSVRTNVPIKNELVVQLMRLAGIRKIKGVSLGKIVGSLISAENDVLLCPGMNAAAMGAGKLLRFHFGCLPVLFFDCLSRIGQSRRGRTAYEQALDAGTGLWFRPSRRIE